jgi:hypothetical protein
MTTEEIVAYKDVLKGYNDIILSYNRENIFRNILEGALFIIIILLVAITLYK